MIKRFIVYSVGKDVIENRYLFFMGMWIDVIFFKGNWKYLIIFEMKLVSKL